MADFLRSLGRGLQTFAQTYPQFRARREQMQREDQETAYRKERDQLSDRRYTDEQAQQDKIRKEEIDRIERENEARAVEKMVSAAPENIPEILDYAVKIRSGKMRVADIGRQIPALPVPVPGVPGSPRVMTPPVQQQGLQALMKGHTPQQLKAYEDADTRRYEQSNLQQELGNRLKIAQIGADQRLSTANAGVQGRFGTSAITEIGRLANSLIQAGLDPDDALERATRYVQQGASQYSPTRVLPDGQQGPPAPPRVPGQPAMPVRQYFNESLSDGARSDIYPEDTARVPAPRPSTPTLPQARMAELQARTARLKTLAPYEQQLMQARVQEVARRIQNQGDLRQARIWTNQLKLRELDQKDKQFAFSQWLSRSRLSLERMRAEAYQQSVQGRGNDQDTKEVERLMRELFEIEKATAEAGANYDNVEPLQELLEKKSAELAAARRGISKAAPGAPAGPAREMTGPPSSADPAQRAWAAFVNEVRRTDRTTPESTLLKDFRTRAKLPYFNPANAKSTR